MTEKPPVPKRKIPTAEERQATHVKYMKEMNEAAARARTISVTAEQGDAEWEKWQELQRESRDERDTDASALKQDIQHTPPTLRPAVVEKIFDGGTHAIMRMTPEEKDNLFDFLDAMTISDSPDKKYARMLMQYVDPDFPMPLPEELQQALRRLIGYT